MTLQSKPCASAIPLHWSSDSLNRILAFENKPSTYHRDPVSNLQRQIQSHSKLSFEKNVHLSSWSKALESRLWFFLEVLTVLQTAAVALRFSNTKCAEAPINQTNWPLTLHNLSSASSKISCYNVASQFPFSCQKDNKRRVVHDLCEHRKYLVTGTVMEDSKSQISLGWLEQRIHSCLQQHLPAAVLAKEHLSLLTWHLVQRSRRKHFEM